MNIFFILFTIVIILNLLENFFLFILIKKKMPNKVKKEKVDFDTDEYINSLKFNMTLDDKIRPLLKIYSNKDITKLVIESLEKEDPNMKYIDKSKLEFHIYDLLSNYNNTFTEEVPDKTTKYYFQEDFVEEVDTENIVGESYQSDKKYTTNLTDTLNNFYK